MPKKKNTPTINVPKIRQLASGSFTCQLRIQGQSISITDPDPNVVLARAMAYKAGIQKVRRSPEDMTLREACLKYIEFKRSILAPSTIEGYEKIVNQHFQGIMDRKLASLTKSVLDNAVSAECARINARGKKMSPKTIKNAFGFVSSVLSKYVPDLETDVDLPEVRRVAVSMDSGDDIIRAVIGTSVELPCLLAAWLCMSMSEIRGLTKSKSLVGRDLVIAETVVYVKGKDERKAGGKEVERSRVIRCPDYIRKLIDQVEGDVIVPDTPHAIGSRYKRILEKKGIPYVSFHKLRHLSASKMAMLGVDRKTAQVRGGWKTSAVMDDIYTHSFTAAQRAADEIMQRHFLEIIANENC